MNNLTKRLIINALTELHDRLCNDSCNDLGGQFLENISDKEFIDIEQEWIKKSPEEAKDYDNELLFDTQLVELLINKIKEENE